MAVGTDLRRRAAALAVVLLALLAAGCRAPDGGPERPRSFDAEDGAPASGGQPAHAAPQAGTSGADTTAPASSEGAAAAAAPSPGPGPQPACGTGCAGALPRPRAQQVRPSPDDEPDSPRSPPVFPVPSEVPS